MAISPMSEAVRHLRRAALLRDAAGMSDEQLVQSFVARRDEDAFAALVRRHGPMVWGVCRRVLRDHHEAEDAFQATFLVLARKAASLASCGLVANWLYGVAYRAALKARAAVARRAARERQVAQMPEPEAVECDLWAELRPVLDRELSCLPEKYRAPLVLCDLGGRTRKEAARQLGVPEGTVAGRLARARALLGRRLARHGVAVSAGALASALSQGAAPGCVPPSLVAVTIRSAALSAAGQAAGPASAAVAALTEGVLKAMFLSRVKVVVALLLGLALLAGGAGLVTRPLPAQGGEGPRAGPAAGRAGGGAGRAAPGDGITLKGAYVEGVSAERNTITVSLGRKPLKLRGTLALPEGGQGKKVTLEFSGVTVSPGAGKLVDVPVAKDAKVRINGKAGKLSAVRPNTFVTLQLAAKDDRLVVVGVLVTPPPGR
jgi:RNA polymerase sigma factor (sigma-70 family)